MIFKKILLNGLTVLVKPVCTIPKVSMQLWYHVGSKDERTTEKGYAHLLEHMIFKGTKKLSESDINAISHKLSAYVNAFTMRDCTAYVFDFPSQQWKIGFEIYADCMKNCHFNSQMLNSELKAVVQELKMYRDDYIDTLLESMINNIFRDHPYKYPVIGLKQDLWNVTSENLLHFYQRHYVPNNATLVVVGDVTPEEVFKEAERCFGPIQVDSLYKKESFYHSKDLISTSTKVYRDIQQPYMLLCYSLQGAKSKKQYPYDVLSVLLGEGKNSRLSKKLVDDLQLATEFSSFVYDLEDTSLFFFYVQPKSEKTIDEIIKLVQDELREIEQKGFTKQELERATNQVKSHYISSFESIQKQVNAIAETYVMTGDENFVANYLNYPTTHLGTELQDIIKHYFSPSYMHQGAVLPLQKEDAKLWQGLQKLADEEDAKISEGRVRDLPIEASRYANDIVCCPPKDFHYPKVGKSQLSNGLKTLVYNNNNVPKIEIVLSLKTKSYDEPEALQGVYTFVTQMLSEGTKNYPGTSLADAMEQYGMELFGYPGGIVISVLKQDFEKGLGFLREVITEVTFENDAIEKIREQLVAQLKDYWDDPKEFIEDIVIKHLFKDHPYTKNEQGTFESLKNITRKDLVEFYQTAFVPFGSCMAIVGDIEGYDIPTLVQKYFGTWNGKTPIIQKFPTLHAVLPTLINRTINRDQVVLTFAGLSVCRLDPDYNKLLLFDQIFCGSMNSRLFQIREQTGLFYTIQGTLVGRTGEQPGIVFVKTIVSVDKLERAKEAILEVIKNTVDTITEQELYEAKENVINSQIENFASNKKMANTFLFLEKFNLPDNYFDTRAESFKKITLEEVKIAAKKILDINKMITVQVGRL